MRGHDQDVLTALTVGQRPRDQQGGHVPQAEGFHQRRGHLEDVRKTGFCGDVANLIHNLRS